MRLFRLVSLLAAVAIVVFAAGIALGQPPANAVRALPDVVERGETFSITVNFTAPADNFSAIALTDFAPAGWNVAVSGAWCQPSATANPHGNNVADYCWWQHPYPNGTHFTALYKVTVPCNASLTNYTFDSDNYAYLVYFIGNSSQIWENVTGDSNVTVVPPAICSTPSIVFYAANGTNPLNKTLELWSSTPCMLNWSLSDDAGWLETYPTNGTCTDGHVPVAVSADSSGMPLGDYTANITIESPDANNSPRIVPVTLHVTDAGVLKGQVDFSRQQPKGDPTWETALVVRFFDNSTELEMVWSPINVTTDAYGNFTIEDVYPGIYDIGIKNWTSLSEMNMGVAFTVANITMVDFGTMREGDADGNDHVAYADYVNFLIHYDVVYANADFDRSGKVGYSDYISLLLNYDKKGDVRNFLLTGC